MKKSTLSALIAATLLGTAVVGNANAFSINSSNSTLTGNSLGLTSWSIGGTNQLSSQAWWFNASSTSGATPYNYELAYYGTSSSTSNSTSSSTTHYLNALGFNVDIAYSIADTGTNSSDLTETVSITNTTASTGSFTLFQLTDFDLGGYAPYNPLANNVGDGTNGFNYGENDTITTFGDSVTQTNGNTTVSETSTLAPTFISIGQFLTLEDALYDGTISANSAPYIGDAAWVFAYDFANIAAGSTVQFTKTVSAVPVPAAVWLFGSGLLGLVGVARRRS